MPLTDEEIETLKNAVKAQLLDAMKEGWISAVDVDDIKVRKGDDGMLYVEYIPPGSARKWR